MPALSLHSFKYLSEVLRAFRVCITSAPCFDFWTSKARRSHRTRTRSIFSNASAMPKINFWWLIAVNNVPIGTSIWNIGFLRPAATTNNSVTICNSFCQIRRYIRPAVMVFSVFILINSSNSCFVYLNAFKMTAPASSVGLYVSRICHDIFTRNNHYFDAMAGAVRGVGRRRHQQDGRENRRPQGRADG